MERRRQAPWATTEATALYNKYGDWLVIKVGAMSFPSRAVLGRRRVRQIHGPSAKARGLSLEAPGAWTVQSGHNLHACVDVTNRSQEALVLETNGVLQASVVDSEGHVVGGYAGFQTAPLVRYVIDVGHTEQVPLLIGTASSDARLGYAVPPGTWPVVVWVPLTDGRLPSGPLPLIITE